MESGTSADESGVERGNFSFSKYSLLLQDLCLNRKLKRFVMFSISHCVGPFPPKISCWWYCRNCRYFYRLSFGYGKDSSPSITWNNSFMDRDKQQVLWSTRVLGIASKLLFVKKVLVVYTGMNSSVKCEV